MNFFSRLYARVMQWSQHRHAPRYLMGLSFAESSFFPIPPDVMLAPMSLAQPQRALHFALLTTVASVAGGIAGYLIGYFALDALTPWLQSIGYWPKIEQVKLWFTEWGVWVVFLAGFSPIPYKLFTITAGALSMALVPFVLASLIGRGARFYLVAGLMIWGGERMEATLRRYMDAIGWFVVLLVVVGYGIYKWL